MNRWLTLLQAFRDGYFPTYHYGLTPRFIIGACQIPIGKIFDTAEKAKKATEQMFNEMKSYNKDGTIVTSNSCDIHKGPVMCLVEKNWSEDTIGTTFEEVWERYKLEIIKGDYHISKEESKTVEQIFT